MVDALDAIESLRDRLETMSKQEKIDVAARLRAAHKTIEELDESIKDDIKLWLKGAAGTVNGEIFKAILSINPTKRLNQKLLKELQPKIHAKYYEDVDQTTINFKPR